MFPSCVKIGAYINAALMSADSAIRDNNALSFYLWSDKRQETCLAEQSDAFDRQPSKKKTRSHRIEFFLWVRIDCPIELSADNNFTITGRHYRKLRCITTTRDISTYKTRARDTGTLRIHCESSFYTRLIRYHRLSRFLVIPSSRSRILLRRITDEHRKNVYSRPWISSAQFSRCSTLTEHH